MAGYEIGVSGLRTAQRALDIIGNNVANAATEGYHRQDIDLRPADESYTGGFLIGQGVDFTGIIRRINTLIEDQILNQDATMSSLNRQMESLRSIESALGELSTPGISTAMDDFYNALYDLSLRPSDITLQSSVVSAAQTLTNQFRNVASVVNNLQDSTYSEAQTTVQEINELASQIAKMNEVIYSQKVRGFDASNMMDQRDQLVLKLNRLAGVNVTEKDYGQVDVSLSDIPLVVSANATEIEVNLQQNGNYSDMVLLISGTQQLQGNITGGSLGGLFSLHNSHLRDILDQLDTLAQTIISETNKLHVQGVGSNGSFTNLTGWTMGQTNVSDFVPAVGAGTIYVRVTAPDGTITRTAITVDSSSTLQSVANDLAAVPGLEDNTGVHTGRLQIVANEGYTFDFLPGVLASPSSYSPSPLAGAGAAASQAPPTINVSGLYTGSINQDYTCTINTIPSGQTCAIGTGTMELMVQDGSGSTIASLNIGEGYEGGSEIMIENGIKVSLGSNGLSPGYLNDGEQFIINALADSDTSGFLAAAGINCFFSGSDASSIALGEDIVQSTSRIAVSRSVEQSDNANIVAIAGLGDKAASELGGLSAREYYVNLTVGVGNSISFTQLQYDNAQGIKKSLESQRDEVSGVDINDQAMQMMIYERLYQAMSKYLNTISDSLEAMMSIIS
ncbi:MAG: flagellar hook-associated protein FlgK [Anaerohalosphaeraceae bacterium]